METTELPDDEKFNILGVVCPRTGQELTLSQALDEGIIDFKRGETQTISATESFKMPEF